MTFGKLPFGHLENTEDLKLAICDPMRSDWKIDIDSIEDENLRSLIKVRVIIHISKFLDQLLCLLLYRDALCTIQPIGIQSNNFLNTHILQVTITNLYDYYYYCILYY